MTLRPLEELSTPITKIFGWAKYIHNEEVARVHPNASYTFKPFNYNVMALKTAQKANVSVWIDLHSYMTQEDIDYTLNLVNFYRLEIAGITRDNEPYVPERESLMETAYLKLFDQRFDRFSWPAISVISKDLGNQGGREGRQNRCFELVNNYRLVEETVENHSYIPTTYKASPKAWILSILSSTREEYSVSNDKIMLGGWSAKNQYELSKCEIETIISDFLNVLIEEEVDNYYQILSCGVINEGFIQFSYRF